MGKQVIISISREYGSGGHEIAKILAERLGMAFYDRSMLDEIAKAMNTDVAELQKYDEKPANRLLSRRVGNHTNSFEEIIAQIQFDYIRKKLKVESHLLWLEGVQRQRHILRCKDMTEPENSIITDILIQNGETQDIMIYVLIVVR